MKFVSSTIKQLVCQLLTHNRQILAIVIRYAVQNVYIESKLPASRAERHSQVDFGRNSVPWGQTSCHSGIGVFAAILDHLDESFLDSRRTRLSGSRTLHNAWQVLNSGFDLVPEGTGLIMLVITNAKPRDSDLSCMESHSN